MTENMVTIKGINGEFTLASWQEEAAFRSRLRKYTIMDARNHVKDVLEDRAEVNVEVNEEDYEELADLFLNGIDCNQSDNIRWEYLIMDYYGLDV